MTSNLPQPVDFLNFIVLDKWRDYCDKSLNKFSTGVGRLCGMEFRVRRIHLLILSAEIMLKKPELRDSRNITMYRTYRVQTPNTQVFTRPLGRYITVYSELTDVFAQAVLTAY